MTAYDAAKVKKRPSRQREYRQLVKRIEAVEDGVGYLHDCIKELAKELDSAMKKWEAA